LVSKKNLSAAEIFGFLARLLSKLGLKARFSFSQILLFQRKTFIQTFWFPSKTFAQT
jgi:hypothetical protein